MSIAELLSSKEFIVASIVFCLESLAIKWLLSDRERLLGLLTESHKTERTLLTAQITEGKRATDEYREFGESTREAMREWTTKIEVLAAAVRGGP